MQFRWSKDDDPFLSLTHDNNYTFHMDANTSLLAKYGTTVVPKYITAGSNPIKIPKKTSLVYILGNTGYSNQIKLPALKAIGHRIEILRNMRYLYNIKVANSSLYQINKMKNSTFIMEPNVSKVD